MRPLHLLRRDDPLGYLWLASGAVLSLFAVHGRWDIPIAAWLSGVFSVALRSYPLSDGRRSRRLGGRGCQRRVLALRVGPRGTRSDPAAVPDAEHGPGDAVPGRPAGRPTAGRHEPATRHLRVPTGTGLLRVPQRPVQPSGNIFGSLAATQYGNLPLLQIAAITGSYGVSFLIAWFAAAANTVWERSATRAQSRTVAVAFVAVLIAVLAGGGSGSAFFPPSASTVRVAGVSLSMAAVAHREEILHRYSSFDELANAEPAVLRPALATVNGDLLAASEREAAAGAKIIVWPEAGAGTLVDDKAGLIARAAALAQRHDVYLHVGVGVLTRRAPLHAEPGHPCRSCRTDGLDLRQGPPRPGHGPALPRRRKSTDRRHTVRQAGQSHLLRRRLPRARTPKRGPRRGHHAGSIQRLAEFGAVHTQKATLRAIENGYSLVRQDTEGLAQVVDFQGHVLAASDYFTTDQQTMVAYVPTQGERTIYAIVGDVFAWLSSAALAVLIGATRLVRRSARRIPWAVRDDLGLRPQIGRSRG